MISTAVQASSDDELISLWLGNYRAARTRDAYAADLQQFRAVYAGPLRHCTVRDIQAFGEDQARFSSSTQARRLSAVKSLISFGHRIGYLPFDVGAPVQLPALRDKLTERILTEEQVQRLFWSMEAPHRRGPDLKRNAALVRLLYFAGLRISEACGVCVRDLIERPEGGQITVFGKGGKTRTILLPAPLWSRLVPLCRTDQPDAPVFLSRQGGPLVRSMVHRIVKTEVKRAGLPANVSAHFLRHSHASHALDRGAPVHVVQSTLGHASLTTTTRYTHARPGDSSSRYLAG